MSDSPNDLPEEPSYAWDEPDDAERPDSPGSSAGSSAEAAAKEEASAKAGPRERHDAFNDARKAAFLEALAKAGCITDAAAAVGVSPRTVYRHQEDDPAFLDRCEAARRMSAMPLVLVAWRRAVEGVDQEFACGGEVHVRRRYSDSLLRLLLIGSNPKKYGPRPGFKRKQLLKHERKALRREIEAELQMRFRPRPLEEVHASILTKLEAIEAHRAEEQLAAGWTRDAEGHWIPPGYAPIPGWTPPEPDPSQPSTPRDSM